MRTVADMLREPDEISSKLSWLAVPSRTPTVVKDIGEVGTPKICFCGHVSPHSAHRHFNPETVRIQARSGRPRNPDQLRRSPATIQPAKAL